MRTSKLMKLTVCGGLLFASSVVNAQAKGGGAAAPAGTPAAPARGGGSAPINRGNGGGNAPANPAPRDNRPVQNAPAGRTDRPVNGGQNNAADRRPNPTGIDRDNRPAGPRTAQGAQDGVGAAERSRESADPNGLSKDGRRGRFGRFGQGDNVVYVPSWYGSGPYAWWGNGSSYWYPPVDGDYRDDSRPAAGSAAAADAPTTVDRPVPNAPSPALEQAQAINGLEGSPAYAGTMAEFKKAQAAYESASRRATEKLKGNQEYQELVGQRGALGDRVEAVQAAAKIPSPDRVTETAQQKLDVSSRITRMEQDAINADPEAKEAKVRMVELNERLTAMRKNAGAR